MSIIINTRAQNEVFTPESSKLQNNKFWRKNLWRNMMEKDLNLKSQQNYTVNDDLNLVKKVIAAIKEEHPRSNHLKFALKSFKQRISLQRGIEAEILKNEIEELIKSSGISLKIEYDPENKYGLSAELKKLQTQKESPKFLHVRDINPERENEYRQILEPMDETQYPSQRSLQPLREIESDEQEEQKSWKEPEKEIVDEFPVLSKRASRKIKSAPHNFVRELEPERVEPEPDPEPEPEPERVETEPEPEPEPEPERVETEPEPEPELEPERVETEPEPIIEPAYVEPEQFIEPQRVKPIRHIIPPEDLYEQPDKDELDVQNRIRRNKSSYSHEFQRQMGFPGRCRLAPK